MPDQAATFLPAVRQTGVELIAAERWRQVDVEEWTAEHDADHRDGELAWAACYYAMPCMIFRRCADGHPCPITPDEVFLETNWSRAWAKRASKSRLRQLVVAGALIAAEIDRRLAAGEVCETP